MAKKWRNKMWSDQDVITLLVDGNPMAPGSKRYERFQHYRNGMTVGEYKDAVGRVKMVKSGKYYVASSDLRDSVERKLINITPVDRMPSGNGSKHSKLLDVVTIKGGKVSPDMYNAKGLWDTLGGPSTSDSLKLKIVFSLLRPEEIGRLVKDLQQAW